MCAPSDDQASFARMELRAALANIEDGEFVATHFDVAGDGMFRWMLGSRCNAILAAAYLAPGHDLSYEHVNLVESQGRPIAMLSGYSSAQHAASSNGPLLRVAGLRSIRIWACGLLGARTFRALDRVPAGDWYLQALSVEPSHRGRGVGSGLLNRAIELARAAGSERIVLDLAIGNVGAQRLYERAGFQIESTAPAFPFEPDSALHRMARGLV